MVKPLSLFSGALLAACMSLPAQADWYLDNESSRLSFISTKAGNLSEVHRFLTLHGRIDARGAARLRVEMESVSTGIPVRDERLRSLLFSTKEFPDAHIMAQLNLAPITDLDTAKKVLKLIDMLEDLDDVQNVYHNAEIPDEIMEQLD
mgnify:CR=1 FL=1